MTGLAGDRAGFGEYGACGDEFIDRVDLPCEVIETDGAASFRSTGGADAEEPEIVVVARAGKPEERGVGPRLPGDDLHAEDRGVELHRAVDVGDEQHGVVEANGGEGHGAVPL